MSKKNITVFKIILEMLKLYFSNILEFIKYMTFPVIGQLIGGILIFVLTYIYSKNIPLLIEKYEELNNFSLLILGAILITLPGLIIFIKTFWEYLVAYGAVNSMYDNMSKSGKVYDFNAHTELIKRRIFSFIGLWTLVGLFCTVGIFPLFWIPAAVLGIFFILIFQIFTFEPNLSPLGCFKKSLHLIKGHFAQTFMLVTVITALTYIFLPNFFIYIFKNIGLETFFASLIMPLIEILPIQEFNTMTAYSIDSKTFSNLVITMIITQIVIQYTLPMRSILWCLWYETLNKDFPTHQKTKKSTKKSSSKKTKLKPSENLMIESNKKFSTKKLDRNILKRAMEKDDEE